MNKKINTNSHNNMTNDMKKNWEKFFRITHKVYEYHPEENGTYIISKKKVPNTQKQPAIIASIILDARFFYEIYSKSFPSVLFTVNTKGEAVPNENYSI